MADPSGLARRFVGPLTFEAMTGNPVVVDLFDANEPIDAVTVSEMLRRDGALERLDDNERSDLYRLLLKASGLWDGVWPDHFEDTA